MPIKSKYSSCITARYERAKEIMQGIWSNKLVFNATVFPIWIGESDCFWYERETIKGREYRLVNAKSCTNQIAFNHCSLANSLEKIVGQKVKPYDLPISRVSMNLAMSCLILESVSFFAFNKSWVFNVKSSTLSEFADSSLNEVASPDGRYVAFERDYNIWVRDKKSGNERAITEDGEEFFVYGATGDAWGGPVDFGLQVRWSPDSTSLLTVQRDTRKVKTFAIVHHVPRDGSIRPKVENVRISHPGDDHIPEYRLVVINIKKRRIQEAHYPRIPVSRNGWGFFGKANLGWWAIDSRRAYFVHQERGDKVIRVVELDARTGATRILFEEISETQINISVNSEDYPPFFPIPETNELVWWSERSGWAHLYLYCLDSGLIKNIISAGDWQVRDVVHFDFKRREVFVQTAGRVSNRDPYYRDLVRINIDSGNITTVASSDHEIVTISQKGQTLMLAYGRDVEAASGVSNTGNYAVITRSRADEVPVSILVDRNGVEILNIETADISALPSNWQWPEPVKLLAADQEADIYGLVFRPSDFSVDQSYPVVSHVFNTPELSWVSKGSFSNGIVNGWPYFDAAALAELGFIVVQIDGRGTPYRNKGFHDASYGWMESSSNLNDHIAGIKQLAKRYPYMDLNRVGITAHTTGGSGGVQGVLQYPEFYKVGITSMLHDSRLMSAPMMGDKYEGISGPSQDRRYPEHFVHQLRGKLLLMHGMLDRTTPPAAMFRLVEALHNANKDFDMIVLPNIAHNCSSYLIRKAWDYLVRHLLGTEPPKEFRLTTVWDSELYEGIFKGDAEDRS